MPNTEKLREEYFRWSLLENGGVAHPQDDNIADYWLSKLESSREEVKREIGQNLEILLAFVEVWNKQDADVEVAEAASEIKAFINSLK